MKTPRQVRALVDWLWFAGWAAASSAWCVTAARELSATFDEPFYVAAGLAFWRTGSHYSLLKKGTMPLAVDLIALPLYLWERWHGVPFNVVADLDRLLPWARAGTLVFWWLLLVYGRAAGRQLAGPWGGRLAVALLACEPSLLAHASLATTDIAVSACVLALVYHFRAGRETAWVRRVGLPTLWFAAAVLAKASGLALGFIAVLAAEVERLARAGAFAAAPRAPGLGVQFRQGLDRLRPLRRDFGQVLAGGLVLVFLYCGSDWRLEPSFVAWAHSLTDGPAGRSMTWLAEHLHIFSNAGEGLVKQITHNIRGHGVYLLGRTDPRALWYYFPVVLAIKLSLPLLIAPALLLLVRPRALTNWACLAAGALLVYSLTIRVQIGIRIVLPLVALAVVGLAAGVVQTCRSCAPAWRRHALAMAAGACVIWMGWSAVAVWPHAIAYVNELWGGTETGYLRVSDSNYDWGQGLKELVRWQRQQGLPGLDVWYFGADPSVRELPLRLVPLHVLAIRGPADVAAQLAGPYLAVSTTWLYGAYLTEAQRQRFDFLRARRPVARTTTFLIYDFTHERDESRPGPGDGQRG